MSEPATSKIPMPVQCAVYATGYFSTGMQNMAALLIPLWLVLTFHPSPFVIGIILGARPLLPALLSIHGGAMMDRLGAKRVMIAFAAIGIVVHLLYPLTGWIWLVVPLQMLSGLATTMSWVGAQTLIGQVMKGDATHSGRLSSAALIGNLTVPPIVGAAWDYLGPWGAFLILTLWSAGVLAAASLLPAPSSELSHAGERLRARDFIPRLSSYIEAVALLAIPAIALVVLISIMRNTTYAIRGSFYVVYLNGLGLTGTEIGFLMSTAGLIGSGAALLAGRASRFANPVILMFLAVAGTVVFICAVPFVGAFWQLMILAGFWGASAGMSMPLMISIMSKAADSRSQGKSVGIRIAANRLAATVLPVAMGAVADHSGIADSFLIVGAALLVALAGVAIFYRRAVARSG